MVTEHRHTQPTDVVTELAARAAAAWQTRRGEQECENAARIARLEAHEEELWQRVRMTVRDVYGIDWDWAAGPLRMAGRDWYATPYGEERLCAMPICGQCGRSPEPDWAGEAFDVMGLADLGEELAKPVTAYECHECRPPQPETTLRPPTPEQVIAGQVDALVRATPAFRALAERCESRDREMRAEMDDLRRLVMERRQR